MDAPPITPDGVKARCSKDFFWMMENVLLYRDLWPGLHRKVCSWLTDWKPGLHIKHLELPREHLKSTCGSIGFPIWCWNENPDYTILLAHGVRKSGVEYVREIKNKLIQEKALHWMNPASFYENPAKEAEPWHQDQFNVRRTPQGLTKVNSLTVTGEGASITGFHYDLVICDDLVHKDNYDTKEKRDKTKKYFDSLMAQVHPGMGRVLVLGTPWHFDDLYAHLHSKENEYHHHIDYLRIPCTVDGTLTGEPIFPKRIWHGVDRFTGEPSPLPDSKPGHTKETLEAKRRSMQADHFSSQFMLDPMPTESKIFVRGDIQWFDLYNGGVPTGNPTLFFTAVDPNRDIKDTSDPAAVVTAGWDSAGHLWVVDCSSVKGSVTNLVDTVLSHVDRWHPEKVLFETVAGQKAHLEELRKRMLTTQRYVAVHEVERSIKAKKTQRIADMEILVKMKALHVLRGYDELVNQLEYLGKWKNDDLADALSDIFHFGLKPDPIKEEKPPTNPFTLESVLNSPARRSNIAHRVYGREPILRAR